MTVETVSDGIAARIRETRRRRRWQVIDLAVRCANAGYPELTENVIENIEGGRRRGGKRTRDITVDELLALAYALDVTPLYLICGLDDTAEIPVTSQLSATALEARNWIQGFGALPGMDDEEYVMSLPVAMRGGYARNVDEAIAALDAMREELQQRRALQERMRSIREQIMEGEG
jgi:transcriptional regulator with XRE-family HTH domain